MDTRFAMAKTDLNPVCQPGAAVRHELPIPFSPVDPEPALELEHTLHIDLTFSSVNPTWLESTINNSRDSEKVNVGRAEGSYSVSSQFWMSSRIKCPGSL